MNGSPGRSLDVHCARVRCLVSALREALCGWTTTFRLCPRNGPLTGGWRVPEGRVFYYWEKVKGVPGWAPTSTCSDLGLGCPRVLFNCSQVSPVQLHLVDHHIFMVLKLKLIIHLWVIWSESQRVFPWLYTWPWANYLEVWSRLKKE